MESEAGAANAVPFLERLIAHKASLDKARSEIGTPGDGLIWYRYDIFGAFWHLDELLQDQESDLRRLAGDRPVADIGAADGDLGLTVEREFGWDVDIIDSAHSNENQLKGATALRDHLGSKAQIADIDLDTQFKLPRERYGLIFFLGILYHLQNPYYALRELAKVSDHCLVSTRVAQFAGPDQTPIGDIPLAYLVSPTETNNDPSNYWIFSPAGLERIVNRTGWEILSTYTVGDTVASDPASPDHDQRTFMLLRSHSADAA